MTTKTKKHLVILVHGIRDIARWESEVGRALQSEGLVVEHTSYGRMNLIQFLLPIDLFRKRAVERVWTDIQHARMLHPGADVSIIAHSFGTYVVTRILKEEFALQLNRLILCGAVVRYDFPFEQIQNRFGPPLLNDVGTKDPWPAFAQAITFGYGAAGTYGFNRPGVRDRFHNDQGHGYFLNADFAKKFWAPFLRDGTLVEGDTNAKAPSLWVRLLSLFQPRWLIATVAVLAIAFFALRAIYGAPPLVMQFGDSSFGFWNGAVVPMLEEAQAECPLPDLVCDTGMASAVTGRRYVTADVIGGDPASVASCGEFHFPAEGAISSDPVAALEALGDRFPQCVNVTVPSATHLSLKLLSEGMTAVTSTRQPDIKWLCGCKEIDISHFKAIY